MCVYMYVCLLYILAVVCLPCPGFLWNFITMHLTVTSATNTNKMALLVHRRMT